MDILIEIILELIFEGSIEIVKSRKVSKWIRYPLIVILSIFTTAVIGVLGIVGIFLILSKDWPTVLAGFVLILFDIIIVLSGVKDIKNEIKQRKTEEKENKND